MQSTNSMFAVITLLIAAIGVVLLVAGFLMARTPGKSTGWSTTTGQILASTINYRRRSGGGHAPYPLVMYVYQVEGQQYQSQRIYFGGAVGGSAMTGIIKKYPVGTQVPVYYNPQNPADAVLERSIPMAKFLGLIGVILIATAAATYFMPKMFGLSPLPLTLIVLISVGGATLTQLSRKDQRARDAPLDLSSPGCWPDDHEPVATSPWRVYDGSQWGDRCATESPAQPTRPVPVVWP